MPTLPVRKNKAAAFKEVKVSLPGVYPAGVIRLSNTRTCAAFARVGANSKTTRLITGGQEHDLGIYYVSTYDGFAPYLMTWGTWPTRTTLEQVAADPKHMYVFVGNIRQSPDMEPEPIFERCL
jgi:hypothetical protein